ncbi:MAG: nicotinamide riboside transporter PnuC [Muribaculaceae bacterium]|nr:nicotinamide riboside transporter PnuC [Muribaculaceae bacterium]
MAEIPWSSLLEVLGFSVGILYLWWEYHADSRLWYASMVMPCISMWLYFSKGIYADFGLNIYYLLIAVYGWWKWRSGGDAGHEGGAKKQLPVTHIPLPMLAAATGVFLLIWAVLFFGLDSLTDSTVPLADSFTTALSIVATWMLARKYIEQWIAWIIVDAVSVGLYIYKGIYFYAVLYVIYIVIAFFGYRKWKSLLRS